MQKSEYKNKKKLLQLLVNFMQYNWFCSIMDKDIFSKPLLNKRPRISQSRKNNNLQYETPQSIATENNESNIIDYRNIPLSLSGEISSSFIHRKNLTQKQPNISFVEDTEDDDEQFISKMKEIIDKNCKMQNKENYSIRDLQSQSYLSRKKKCAFSEEDENLMKRFKKSVNENKALCAIPQKVPQQSENVTSVRNSKCSILTTPKVTSTSTVTLNKIDTDFRRCNTDQLVSYMTSQKNDQLITPKNTEYVTETEIVETEIEQLVYCAMHYLTPPERDDNLLS